MNFIGFVIAFHFKFIVISYVFTHGETEWEMNLEFSFFLEHKSYKTCVCWIFSPRTLFYRMNGCAKCNLPSDRYTLVQSIRSNDDAFRDHASRYAHSPPGKPLQNIGW